MKEAVLRLPYGGKRLPVLGVQYGSPGARMDYTLGVGKSLQGYESCER